MNKFAWRWIGIGSIALSVPLAAAAQQAFTRGGLNLRAGPAPDYPVVATLGGGQPVEVLGCTNGYSWCDVVLPDGLRGWVYAPSLDYAYEQQRVPLATYGAVIGVPIVAFTLGSYWSSYYRDRPWYGDRRWWGQRPPPPVQGWRPPPPPRPEWRPNPWRPGGPGGPGPGFRPRPEPRPSPGPGFRPPRDDGFRPRPDPGVRPGRPPGPRPEVRPDRPRPQSQQSPGGQYVRGQGGQGAGRPDRGPREGGGRPQGQGRGGDRGEHRGGGEGRHGR